MPGCYNIGRGCHIDGTLGHYRECIHCNTALKAGALVTLPPRPKGPGLEFIMYTNEAGKIDFAEAIEHDA